MSYPNQPPVVPGGGESDSVDAAADGGERPLGPDADEDPGSADARTGDGDNGLEPDFGATLGAADTFAGNGERPLDPDLDDDDVNSAAADERAATEGTLDGTVDDRP